MNIENTNRNEPKQLFKNLMNLAENNEAFYFVDQEININNIDYIIRSFSYRLATYNDFQNNLHLDSRESRGTAFYKIKNTNNWEIFARAYPKFWNLGEGIPVNEFVQKNKPILSLEKLDGSLIMFGKIDNVVIAKSKTSINSTQAKMAQKIYNENNDIKKLVDTSLNKNINRTPVFELIGPDNVIVLRYKENTLVNLGDVDLENGEVHPLVDKKHNNKLFPNGYEYNWDELLEIKENSKPDIEGFIVITEKDLVKVKVNSYIQLHHLKDSINNFKILTQTILDDNIDDLIGSFQDDQNTIDYIVKIQEKIGHLYNHIVNEIETFYNKNKDLNRKDFAIKSKNELGSKMGLAMNLYLGKNANYKDFIMKNKLYEGIEKNEKTQI